MLVLNLPAFENKKYTADNIFHGNGPYGEILTNKEPIRTAGLLCHMIQFIIYAAMYIHFDLFYWCTYKLAGYP